MPVELGIEVIPKLAVLPDGPPILLDPLVIRPAGPAVVDRASGSAPPNGVSNNI
jgi:hypothetical protein